MEPSWSTRPPHCKPEDERSWWEETSRWTWEQSDARFFQVVRVYPKFQRIWVEKTPSLHGGNIRRVIFFLTGSPRLHGTAVSAPLCGPSYISKPLCQLYVITFIKSNWSGFVYIKLVSISRDLGIDRRSLMAFCTPKFTSLRSRFRRSNGIHGMFLSIFKAQHDFALMSFMLANSTAILSSILMSQMSSISSGTISMGRLASQWNWFPRMEWLEWSFSHTPSWNSGLRDSVAQLKRCNTQKIKKLSYGFDAFQDRRMACSYICYPLGWIKMSVCPEWTIISWFNAVWPVVSVSQVPTVRQYRNQQTTNLLLSSPEWKTKMAYF